MVKDCPGCGARLQSDSQEQPGYLPAELLTRDQIVCQRCFKLSHYNELTPMPIERDRFLSILHRIGEERALVIKLVDLFDFNGSWLSGIARIVNHNPILLAVNKIDLFPDVNQTKIRSWLHRFLKEDGLAPRELILLSARTGQGIGTLLEAINKHRMGRDVYLIGSANVGKSTLINQILSRTDQLENQRITTSYFPGTTIDMIDIPLPDGSVIHDTPGVMTGSNMTDYVTPKDFKLMIPDSKLKPKVYQLNPGQTLFFGGLARLDFLSGERQSFVCYMGERLPIHRTKLNRADDLYTKHLGGLLHPPRAEALKGWEPLKQHSFRLHEEGDVVFPGLGWVAIKGRRAQVDAYAPPGVTVSVRPTLI